MNSNAEKDDSVDTKSLAEVDVKDVEQQNGNVPTHSLQRKVKDRQIAMISIGGVIGTGLFVGTANGLVNGGPVGLLLAYMFTGAMCYTMMISLGEMISYLPVPGGHIALAGRFVDPAFSFTLGWMYWYNWILVLPAEMSAVGVLMQYWEIPVSMAVWITVCLVVIVAINMLGAGVYAECEFIFASIKIIAIVGLIILGIILDLGGVTGDRIGFRYWKNPGPFVQFMEIDGPWGRFLGFWRSLIVSAGAYVGTEIVAIAAAETKNPRRNLPKAIKRVYIRILVFYIGSVWIVGMLVPSNDPRMFFGGSDASASPFVIAIERAGINALPSIINAVLVTAAWSAGSSDLYTSSRALYGLAANGNAPKIFLKVTGGGIPYVSILFCSMFSTLAYMTLSTSSAQVFTWFQNLTSTAGMITWMGSTFTYLRKLCTVFTTASKLKAARAQTFLTAPESPLQPYAAYFAFISAFIVCFFSGWTTFLHGQWATDTFVTNYFGCFLFPVMYVGCKFWKKSKVVSLAEMDFVTGVQELDADEAEAEERRQMEDPKNVWQRVWRWLL